MVAVIQVKLNYTGAFSTTGAIDTNLAREIRDKRAFWKQQLRLFKYYFKSKVSVTKVILLVSTQENQTGRETKISPCKHTINSLDTECDWLL